VLRLALRELRAGLRGFGIFLACIALGVMAIAGVASISRSLTEGLAREGRKILGGDMAYSLIHREATDRERAVLGARGNVSVIATMRGMANAGEKGSGLVELKAVDGAYPTVGELVTEPPLPIEDLLAIRDGVHGAAVDPVLLARLDLKIGDRIMLGTADVELRAAIRSEPDKIAAGVGFGPRLLMSTEALRATGLVQPGSLVRWTYRLDLPSNAAGDADLARVEAAVARDAPEAGWEVRSRVNADPRFARNIERFAQFLTLVGLTALLVGGVGVANAGARLRRLEARDDRDPEEPRRAGLAGGGDLSRPGDAHRGARHRDRARARRRLPFAIVGALGHRPADPHRAHHRPGRARARRGLRRADCARLRARPLSPRP
jgi:putative ABC transport system permease protein